MTALKELRAALGIEMARPLCRSHLRRIRQALRRRRRRNQNRRRGFPPSCPPRRGLRNGAWRRAALWGAILALAALCWQSLRGCCRLRCADDRRVAQRTGRGEFLTLATVMVFGLPRAASRAAAQAATIAN
eukprot:scaffold54418_cov31-Tisochrysis_lutea.AAC.4